MAVSGRLRWRRWPAAGCRLLPATPEGMPLERFLPETSAHEPEELLRRRAALASTLVAGLELEREGQAVLAQDEPFAAILLTLRDDRRLPRRG